VSPSSVSPPARSQSWSSSSATGEAAYAVNIRPGETILVGNGRDLRVLDVVGVEKTDSPYAGLKAEAA